MLNLPVSESTVRARKAGRRERDRRLRFNYIIPQPKQSLQEKEPVRLYCNLGGRPISFFPSRRPSRPACFDVVVGGLGASSDLHSRMLDLMFPCTDECADSHANPPSLHALSLERIHGRISRSLGIFYSPN